jgi:hypothetical protein
VVSPSSVVAGASAGVTVSASDADGDNLAYAYAPNGGAIQGSGSSVTWPAPPAGGLDAPRAARYGPARGRDR